MHLKEIGKPDAKPVSMDWDQAQAALRSGAYEIHSEGLMEDASTRSGPIVADLPAAGEPAPAPAAEPGPAAATPASKGKAA